MNAYNLQETYNVQIANDFTFGAQANEENKQNEKKVLSEEIWIKRIEETCKIYRMSQLFLEDAKGDYGKQKIAQLRFEFAKHKLFTLLEEVSKKGIIWSKNELLRKYLYEF
jgi:hypothetical protein